jgi:hypothetical protein
MLFLFSLHVFIFSKEQSRFRSVQKLFDDHSGKFLRCPICKKEKARETTMKQHIKNKHGPGLNYRFQDLVNIDISAEYEA